MFRAFVAVVMHAWMDRANLVPRRKRTRAERFGKTLAQTGRLSTCVRACSRRSLCGLMRRLWRARLRRCPGRWVWIRKLWRVARTGEKRVKVVYGGQGRSGRLASTVTIHFAELGVQRCRQRGCRQQIQRGGKKQEGSSQSVQRQNISIWCAAANIRTRSRRKRA